MICYFFAEIGSTLIFFVFLVFLILIREFIDFLWESLRRWIILIKLRNLRLECLFCFWITAASLITLAFHRFFHSNFMVQSKLLSARLLLLLPIMPITQRQILIFNLPYQEMLFLRSVQKAFKTRQWDEWSPKRAKSIKMKLKIH